LVPWNDSRARSFFAERPVFRASPAPFYDVLAVREPSSSLPRGALEHIDSLYHLARHMTGDDDEAEDLVQETYARAVRKRAQFADGTNVRAWLFRILRNLFVDAWRRRRRSPVTDRLDDEAGEAGTSREPLRGDEELELLRRVVAEDIDAALAALSVDARTIVLLDMEGLTQEEMAEVLGCEVGTVKSRLSRARARLREKLRHYAR
jgi:RNA polymerase sigma-70 factor (ECF subfamily)